MSVAGEPAGKMMYPLVRELLLRPIRLHDARHGCATLLPRPASPLAS